MPEKMQLIDISNIECWKVNLLPFDDVNKWDADVLPLQLEWKDKGIFGIGWNNTSKDYGEMTDESIKAYLSDYRADDKSKDNKPDSSQINALNCLKEIKIGHYLIMRLRNSHFYIGKVDQTAKYNAGIDESSSISWYCHVEEWIEFENEELLPSEIVGRFSQSHQATIVRLNTRQKLLVIKAYVSKKEEDTRIGQIPKVHLSISNFNRSLNDKELEDLVCAHIYYLNPGYFLLPSSCKKNRPKFEFTFVKKDARPITCQVKNQRDLPSIDEYKDETTYEKIYLYSGTLTDQQVEELNEAASKYNHIEYIKPSDLFETLCGFEYFLEKMKSYYMVSDVKINVAERLNNSGWQLRKSFKGKITERYKIFDHDVVSIGSDKLYYSPDFNVLILNDADDDIPREYCEKVQELLAY